MTIWESALAAHCRQLCVPHSIGWSCGVRWGATAVSETQKPGKSGGVGDFLLDPEE